MGILLALLLLAVTLQSSLAYAADPLLEKLKQKGILTEDEAARLLIAGLSYDVYKHNMAMLNYERFSYDRNHSKVGGLANADDYEHKVQFVYQISF
ncbi:MAG TPA: hypothetical protein ENN18_05080 [Proteobacteria bacterium]|nr:hypothetical protein [Pseudomonadota bacterium]